MFEGPFLIGLRKMVLKIVGFLVSFLSIWSPSASLCLMFAE